MDNLTLEVLFERVNRIERRCYVWRLLAIGALLAITLLLILGTVHRRGSPETVIAKGFVVVDENGRDLIRLGRYDEAWGKASLEFLDGKGVRRIVIAIDKGNAPYISLMDPEGGDQLVLDVQPGKGSAIAFRNRKSPSGLLLAAGPPGVSAIGFMDKDGNRLLEIGLEPDGAGRLTLRSKEGMKLFELPK